MQKIDKRITKIAKLLVNYSCDVKKGDNVIIFADVPAKPIVFEIYKECLRKKAYPKINWNVDGQSLIYYKYASEKQIKNFPEISYYEMKKADAVMYISATENKKELASANPKKISLRSKATKKIMDERLKKRWLIFAYPTKAYSDDANMSLNLFTNLIFNSTLIDWKKIRTRLQYLKKILDKGKKIRILAKDTDLSFSIEGRKFIVCDGKFNMPDGEIFTSPRHETFNGYIKFSFPRWVYGEKVNDIFLRYKNGNLVQVKASQNLEKLKALLKTDKGANSIGEFSFGMNPKLNRYTNELLFDEKINGTIHLALGNAYKEAVKKGKANKSAVHLDIVKDMKKGKIFLDDRLIYKNGKFII